MGPDLYQELKQRLGFYGTEETEEEEDKTAAVVKKQLEETFAFSSYLAANVQRGMKDSIELHAGTWITISILFAVLAMMCRLLRVSILGVMPVFVCLALLIVLLMVLLTRSRHRAISRHSQKWLERIERNPAPRRSVSGRSIDVGASEDPTHAYDSYDYAADAPANTLSATLQGRGKYSFEKFINRFLQIFLPL
ncbi:unnamed protein product [Effrenium voratum]|uniref:Uncharacterized protein n=1 Tax=Effrenium voratum TaxID=2562239 RepID=A0AA36MK97_9DINO|nr:unnamed protein product [Effrenium voratum]